MFIKTSQFKKLLKRDYNSAELNVFRTEDELCVGGSNWEIVVDAKK